MKWNELIDLTYSAILQIFIFWLKKKRNNQIPSKGSIKKKGPRGQKPKSNLQFRNKPITNVRRRRPGSLILVPVSVPVPVIIVLFTVSSSSAVIAVVIFVISSWITNVVIGALSIVAENLVGLGDLLESEGCVFSNGIWWLWVLVRVIFYRQIPKCFLDFISGSVFA